MTGKRATRNGWDASANVPTLSDGTGAANQAYIVTVAATRNLGSGNITFAVTYLLLSSQAAERLQGLLTDQAFAVRRSHSSTPEVLASVRVSYRCVERTHPHYTIK